MFVTYQALLSDQDPRWESQKAMYEAELEAFEMVTTRYVDQPGEIAPGMGLFSNFDEEWV
jgi:hypothetical protein